MLLGLCGVSYTRLFAPHTGYSIVTVRIFKALVGRLVGDFARAIEFRCALLQRLLTVGVPAWHEAKSFPIKGMKSPILTSFVFSHQSYVMTTLVRGLYI